MLSEEFDRLTFSDCVELQRNTREHLETLSYQDLITIFDYLDEENLPKS